MIALGKPEVLVAAVVAAEIVSPSVEEAVDSATISVGNQFFVDSEASSVGAGCVSAGEVSTGDDGSGVTTLASEASVGRDTKVCSTGEVSAAEVSTTEDSLVVI